MKGIDKIKQFQDLIESRDYFEIAKMLTRIKAEEVLPKEKKYENKRTTIKTLSNKEIKNMLNDVKNFKAKPGGFQNDFVAFICLCRFCLDSMARDINKKTSKEKK